MLDKVRVKVYGKLNLSLNITGKSGDMHLIDSTLASLSVCDVITVRDRLDDKINLIFNADYAVLDNSVIKAVNALRKSFGCFGADIVVDKHIPLGGGMGGSSADGAGVIIALNRLFDFDKRGLDLPSTCEATGADVMYMTRGGYARMRGFGGDVSPIECDKEYGVVYSYCGVSETGAVYRKYDEIGSLGGETDNDLVCMALAKGEKPPLGNMLYAAASALLPKIASLKAKYEEVGLVANMTGSGSTIYALSDDPERDAMRLKERGIDADCAFTQPFGVKWE